MTRVTVVGGGLAGMAAAWAIRGLGLPVRLLEAAPELGGMSGSRVIDGRVEDHGVHVFPAWYNNALHLIDELGIAGNLLECDNFYQLMPGEFPKFRTFPSIVTAGDFVRDVRSGVTPVPDRLLFYYGVLDLLGHDYDAGSRDESLADFLRTRWYLTEAAVADIEHLFVASSAAESDLASAASFRGSVAAFAKHPGKVRMPKGSLQESFIGPFRRRLEERGVEVRTGVELVEASVAGERLDAIAVRVGDDTVTERVDGHVVLAIPPKRLAGLGPAVTDALLPRGVEKLRPRALGALHLYLRRRLPGLPHEHVRLVGSPHAITLVDVGQVWDGSGTSLLNCVAGRVSRLAELSADEAVKVLVEELMTYLPVLTWDDIEHVCYQPHFAEPFFAPEPGADRYRPGALTALANLHVAGDFCASPPGVAGMEGAIRSGLAAAESVRQALRPDAPPVRIRDPHTVSPRAARAARVALAPVAAVVRLLAGRRRRRQRRG